MNHKETLLENLTRSSIRLNRGLLAFLVLTLLLIGISYWSTRKLVDEQYGTFDFHFTRMMGGIQEHEIFLGKLIGKGATDKVRVDNNRFYLQKKLPEFGPDVYEGREFPFSIPFSFNAPASKIAPDQLPKLLSLGSHLVDFYGAFWAISHYQAPQVFLFNAEDNFSIVVPAAGQSPRSLWKVAPSNQPFTRQLQKRLMANSTEQADGVIRWEPIDTPRQSGAATQLMAFVTVPLPPELLPIQGASDRVGIASLLNMDQLNNIDRVMAWSMYDHFTLIAPTGKVLVGLAPAPGLHEGLNLTRDGLVFKVSNKTGEAWSALYTVSFKSYFQYTLWPMLALLMLLIGLIVGGWRLSRWYRSRVVTPAYNAHQRLVESEAFSRVVIDSAPIGLCVVRRADFKVLLANQKAQQWQGSIKRLRPLFTRQQSPDGSGETQLDIDGTHLQVGFVPTRYQGEDALLCAFNDVTSHVEDAAVLEQARLAADAANKAKTLFLATMSHEIRTPLYGVLGTLELLGLTRLDTQQRTHLQTIQRSSTTLFQLISDVLDISKIESGQMDIESTEFCPLQMIEDTLHTYAAFAEQKGLLLYACVDAALPDLLLGDPTRIRQILNNLVSNAIKFTDAGRVVLRARLVHCVDGRASVEWQVTDSGIGISPEQQERLFDTFYQVRDASSEAGAGLGLAICRWLAEMMDGQIRVVSEPGLGSSFSLQLKLKTLPGTLAGCDEILPTTQAVYVRAPAAELAQSTCDWLNRLGIVAKPLPGFVEESRQNALLVDVLPGDASLAWAGPRVLCTAGDHRPTQATPADHQVDAHDVRAIARVVSLTLHGKSIAPPSLEARPAGQLGLHILVAEDNPVNQAIIKEQLEALGCTVTTASNGEEALQLWQPQVFDLVLTDVNMPLRNGYELTQALRERDRQIPIIGVTANAMREEGARCLAVGMNAWIVKPLSLQTLHHYLSKLCASTPPQEPRPMIQSTPAPAPDDTMIELSPKMRELFISTMRQDIRHVTDALQANDAKRLAERLHSAAGALGAVQMTTLAKTCAEQESQILQSAITPSVVVEVEGLIQRLSDILNALE
ncbi:hybrid sensor histidine kinase/response regulator [Pseudomonas chlororaphis]|uniref:histidine kinase n=1 Tax=Pseudomonas chlororaphis TaxID=587753 RepID=A0A1Q8EPH7_9PSED|nr:hybrid sensor histidine kinase/response regulator [Pseudomonas chlororaphis]OLF53700.1 hybrid sensor histidine kinase/response regulator [Pseudomonas chlororaphis]